MEADNPEIQGSDNKDKVPDTVISDEEDESFAKDTQPWGSTTKRIKLLFEHYK